MSNDARNKKAMDDLNKVNGLRRLSNLLGAGSLILITVGCLIFIVLCLLFNGS